MSENQIIANRFEIVGTIGKGGMGDVYRGVDRDTGETVAIKLLKPDIIESDPKLIERFEREGEILRQLDHPNIVKILATVEEEGLHYLIMEYVAGGSLRDLLEEQPQLPVGRVLEIALDLADALTRAHRLSVIHRDLKPANVLLAEDGTPRLTDFGVARIGGRSRVTETGSLLGTYSYISPEACMGTELDPRADIWSFGIMLYEMLAGERPFESDTGAAILIAILQNPLPDLTEFRPDTPPALVNLINQMLEKDREQRIPSVRLVGAELEALLHGVDSRLIPIGPLAEKVSEASQSRFATPTPTQPPHREALPISETLTPITFTADGTGGRKVWWAFGGGAIAVLVALIVAGVALGWLGGDDEGAETGPSATAAPTEIAAVVTIPTVAPVAADEYMVLVAELEPLGGVEERDVTRFIVENLVDTLENQVPFSSLRIRAYPQVITSKEEAQEAAEVNGATVVVWGNYTPEFVELNTQIGVTTAFSYIDIARDKLERAANLRVHIGDERNESAALSVLHVLNVLFAADGDGYEVMRTFTIIDEIEVARAEVVSGGISAYLYGGMLPYLEDTPSAVDAYSAAIEIDPGSPFPYAFRAASYMRLGDYERALRDVESTQRLGPAGWTIPPYVLVIYEFTAGHLDEVIARLDEIVTARPDDWFPEMFRAANYYLSGDYDRAKEGVARAIALGPNANYPYFIAMMLALREGRLVDMQASMDTILTEFPDPTFASRTIQAWYGSETDNIFGPLFSTAGNLIIGQYESVVDDAEVTLSIDDQIADVHLMQGVAYCNLGDYEDAEAAYTRGIDVDPGFVALYALRAETRLRQGNMAGALEDTGIVEESELSDVFTPLLQAGLSGEWSCEMFFGYDYAQLGTEAAAD